MISLPTTVSGEPGPADRIVVVPFDRLRARIVRE